jgi:hypothetical protein
MENITKVCRSCNKEKDICLFAFRKDRGKYENECRSCHAVSSRNYYEHNKEYVKDRQKEYKEIHKDEIKEYQDNYNIVNRDKKLQYKKDNKRAILANNRVYAGNKYKSDPVFRMRETVSKTVYNALKKLGIAKDGSILDHLQYSMQELKEHIEKQFASWMTWDNQGKYNAGTWDDNDQSTWTWQLDHIVPQSDLPYTSMADNNFRKCWALNNLRPLGAKQNLLDGVGRVRHGVARKKTTKTN